MGRPAGSKNKVKKIDGATIPHGKPRSQRAKAPKPAKAAKAVQGDNSTDKEKEAKQELFREYRRKLAPALAKLDAAKKVVNEIYAEAKGDKIPKKLFAIDAELNGTAVQEQKAIQRVHDTAWVAEATGHTFAEQLSLFADEPTRIKPWNEGQEASESGKPLKPPYPPGTKDYDEFVAGWHAHQEKLAKNIKPLAPATQPDDDDDWGDDPGRALQH